MRFIGTHTPVPLQQKKYDVAIIGAGVTGTALLYILAKYTDIGRICLVEKCGSAAEVSSHPAHNSQTLHFGDIETNYTLEKAAKVKTAAEMIVRYVSDLEPINDVAVPMQKMVLGVGEKEVAVLRERFAQIRELFSEARLLEADELALVEPKVMAGRSADVPVAAIFSRKGYAIDFGKLAASFVSEAKKNKPEAIDFFFDTRVRSMHRRGSQFVIETDAGEVIAGAVAVAAGAHSLRLAHRLGYGRDFTILPVAGDYFTAPNVLNGKVYTVQEPSLPFAAVHADPDVLDPETMRFGPVAVAVPILEPGRWRTMWDFFGVFRPNLDGLLTAIKVNTDPIVLKFVLRHLLYYLPYFGRRLFAADAAKIIPTLKPDDIVFAKNQGGIRPQVAHVKKHVLQQGEAKIVAERIIFNITPSPGASVCLQNAVEDARHLMGFFGGRFRLDEAALKRDLG